MEPIDPLHDGIAPPPHDRDDDLDALLRAWRGGAPGGIDALAALEPVSPARRYWMLRARQAQGDEAGVAKALASLDDAWALAWRRELLLGAGRAREAATVAAGDGLDAALVAHLAGDFAAAEALCSRLLDGQAPAALALNHRARARFNLVRREQALEDFAEATRLAPAFAEAWCNLGRAMRACDDLDRARQAGERAVALRPGAVAFRLELARTLLAAADGTAAEAALAPACDGPAPDASALVERGLSRQQQGRLEDAVADYRAGLALAPGLANGWYYLGSALNALGQGAAAREALERALSLRPDDAEAWAELAALHEADNHLEDMAAALARSARAAPPHPRLALEQVRLLRRQRRHAEALAQLGRLPPEALPTHARAAWHFERARLLDASGDTGSAFEAFTRANALSSAAARRGDGEGLLRVVEDTRVALPALRARFADWRLPSASQGEGSPILLLGFPRSGITLLESMLAAHPDLVTLQERPTFEAVAAGLAGRGGYPGVLATLDRESRSGLAAQYRERVAAESAEALAALDRGQLVDMFPLRSLHLPLLAATYPGARVVFVARHPADVVLSNFMQDFAPNAAAALCTTLESTARFYAQSMALALDLLEALPLRVSRLRYERLAQAPEPTMRALLAGLGLDWSDEVLRHEMHLARRGRVSTSSYHQVARPVHAEAIERWRRYARELEAVRTLLAPVADRLGYRFDPENAAS